MKHFVTKNLKFHFFSFSSKNITFIKKFTYRLQNICGSMRSAIFIHNIFYPRSIFFEISVICAQNPFETSYIILFSFNFARHSMINFLVTKINFQMHERNFYKRLIENYALFKIKMKISNGHLQSPISTTMFEVGSFSCIYQDIKLRVLIVIIVLILLILLICVTFYYISFKFELITFPNWPNPL